MTVSITCPLCGKTSHHPQDVANEYCGWCHQFHGGRDMTEEPEGTTDTDTETDTGVSEAEQAAQSWHDQEHGSDETLGECWCCCPACKCVNPHRRDAARAAVQDIKERIRESSFSSRPPDHRYRR